MPGFPNLLMMYGPNTNTGGGSIIYFLEAQARFLGDYVDHLAATRRPIAVRADVEQAFDDAGPGPALRQRVGQCSSWYRNASGRDHDELADAVAPVQGTSEVRPC